MEELQVKMEALALSITDVNNNIDNIKLMVARKEITSNSVDVPCISKRLTQMSYEENKN